MFDRAAAIEACYRRMIDLAGASALTHYETGNMAGAKPLKSERHATVAAWLGQARRPKDIYQLILSRHHGADIQLPILEFSADEEDDIPTGSMRLCLPIDEWQDKDANEVVRQVTQTISGLDLESGHAGLSLAYDCESDEVIDIQQAMSRLAVKAPGVDLHDMDTVMVAFGRAQGPVVKRADWLTILGKELAAAPGLAADLNTLPSSVTVHRFDTGVVLQAGDAPSLGGQGVAADLPAHAVVGRLIRPYRLQGIYSLFGYAIPDPPAFTQAWLGRFDG